MPIIIFLTICRQTGISKAVSVWWLGSSPVDELIVLPPCLLALDQNAVFRGSIYQERIFGDHVRMRKDEAPEIVYRFFGVEGAHRMAAYCLAGYPDIVAGLVPSLFAFTLLASVD